MKRIGISGQSSVQNPPASARWNWKVVLGSMFGGALGAGPVMVISFGIFLKPVSEAFGWDRSVMSGGLTLAIFFNAVGTPVVGRLIDQLGNRRVTMVSLTLFAMATAAMSMITEWWPLLMVLYAIWGLTSAGTAQLPYVAAISTTFERNRGLALGIGLSGLGIGSALIPPLCQWMVENFGWRGAYFGLGSISFVIPFLCWLLLIKPPRADHMKRPATPNEPRTLRDILTRLDLWLICVPVMLMSFATNGILTNLVPILTDEGMGALEAASYASIVGAMTIIGKVSSGLLVDRYRPEIVSAAYFSIPVGAISLLLSGHAVHYPVLMMVSIGLTHGAEVALAGTLVARFFGLSQFGTIFGFTAISYTIGVGLGPLVMNLAYDRLGSYDAALIAFAIGLVLASLLVGSLRARQEPVSA